MWKDVAVANFKVVSRNFIRKSENKSEPGAMGLGTPKYGARGVSLSAKLTLGFFINSSTKFYCSASKTYVAMEPCGFEIDCQEANTAK
jgi:hypothetical protein